jgi:hypothetical protein
LNLRPPGYEPGELPDCSTPRRGPDCSTLVTIGPMWDWAIWGALILSAVAGIAAIAPLAVRGRVSWRDFKRTRRDVMRGLDELLARGETTAEKVAGAGDTVELQESLGRLRISLAQLAVLRGALGEAQDTFGRVTAFVPRK